VLDPLDRDARLRLMKFVCSFAWADLQVRPEEVGFVARIFRRLGLDDAEWRQVQGWLDVPPDPESVDPTRIPNAHRKVFLEAIEGIIASDDEISPMERENLNLFRQLLS
jgi:uncharacterized tellurite resistance protein B-like protein